MTFLCCGANVFCFVPGRYTYDACEAVPYQSDYQNDDDDGYIFHGSSGGVSYCDGTALLGGYNKLDLTDMVSKLVELPLHTSMKVRACIQHSGSCFVNTHSIDCAAGSSLRE